MILENTVSLVRKKRQPRVFSDLRDQEAQLEEKLKREKLKSLIQSLIFIFITFLVAFSL
jgi:hypothetical protein